MRVGIHYNKNYHGPNYPLQRYTDILRFNDIDTELLYAGSHTFWERVEQCDLFIFRWGQTDWDRQIAPTILYIVENEMKVKCFPNSKSSWLYDNKIRQYYLLKLHGYPVVESYIFYDISSAKRFIEEADYPLVFKLTSGAGSRMVRLLKNKTMAMKYINLMFKKGISYKKGLPDELYDQIKFQKFIPTLRKRFGKFRRRLMERNNFYEPDWQLHKNYFYLQKFCPENHYDTRVVVIGKRAAAFRRINRKNDFRASGGVQYSVERGKIDKKFIEIAFDVSMKFGFDAMAYDFLYDEKRQPVISEISYAFGSSKKGSKISICPGYWDDKMNWRGEPLDVEYCILSDLLKDVSLKNVDSQL
jgi:glutathione synthase/RimK-type ligase-like ATP-grasp enzyme